MWLTVFNAPRVCRLRCGERTSERSFLAGRKCERLVRECASAKCAIPKCDANGDLGFSIFAIVHDPTSSCSRWAVLARYLWIDDGFAMSSCFGADWAGIEYRDVCTVGKLSKLSWRAIAMQSIRRQFTAKHCHT